GQIRQVDIFAVQAGSDGDAPASERTESLDRFVDRREIAEARVAVSDDHGRATPIGDRADATAAILVNHDLVVLALDERDGRIEVTRPGRGHAWRRHQLEREDFGRRLRPEGRDPEVARATGPHEDGDDSRVAEHVRRIVAGERGDDRQFDWARRWRLV